MIKRLWLAALMLFIGYTLPAQTGGTVTIGTGSYAQGYLGINFGDHSYYDGYFWKNLLYNPSMQTVQYRFNETAVSGGSTTSFTSDNQYDHITTNALVGATYEVTCNGASGDCTGGAKGCTGLIAANTDTGGFSHAPTFTLGTACGSSISNNSSIVIRAPATLPVTTAGNFTWGVFGWNHSGSGTATIDDGTSCGLPAAQYGFAQPKQVVLVTNTSGQTVTLSQFFDSSSRAHYNFTGPYNMGAQVKVISGSLTLTTNVNRSGGVNAGGSTGMSGATWTAYNTTFTASEPSSQAAGTVNINFTISGTGSACVYGMDLESSADTNPTQFRDAVVNQLIASGTKELRFHQTGAYGWTPTQIITPITMQQGAQSSTNSDYLTAIYTPLNLYEELTLAKYLNIKRVSIVVPATFTAAEQTQLMDFLAGSTGTTFGGYRSNLGHSATWLSDFDWINLEWGNEPWNTGTFPGSSWAYNGGSGWNYIPLTITACTNFKANAGWDSNKMKCTAGFQPIGTFFLNILQTLDTGHKVDLQGTGGYTLDNITSCTDPGKYEDAYAWAWANAHDTSWPHEQMLNFTAYPFFMYEFQNQTVAGSCSQAQLNPFPETQGYAIANMLEFSLMNRDGGMTDANFWQFDQYQNGISTSGGASSIQDFGIVVGSGGGYNRARPSSYAMKMLMDATIGPGITTTTSGVPTRTTTATNGLNVQNNVPILNYFVSGSGSNRTLTAYNTAASTSYTFAVNGVNPPTGTVNVVDLTATNITDNNETTTVVTSSTSTLTNPTLITIAPHSMKTLAWSTTGTATGGKIQSGKSLKVGKIK